MSSSVMYVASVQFDNEWFDDVDAPEPFHSEREAFDWLRRHVPDEADGFVCCWVRLDGVPDYSPFDLDSYVFDDVFGKRYLVEAGERS